MIPLIRFLCILLLGLSCVLHAWSNNTYDRKSQQNFRRNIQELEARLDAFNKKLSEITNFPPISRATPFSSRPKKHKDPAKLFDELFPSPDNPINQPQINARSSFNTELIIPDVLVAKKPEKYPVMPLVISYGGDDQGLPLLSELEKIRFPSQKKGGLIDLGGLMKPTLGSQPFLLSTLELREISQICVHYLKEKGFEGMVAMVHPAQIDPSNGADLRGPGETGLEIKVWVARITTVRLAYSGAGDENKTRQKVEKILAKQMWKQRVLGQPLTKKFKKTVKRLGRSPSKSSRLLLLPGDRPGEVEGVVDIKEQKRTQFSLGVANSGSPSTGKWLWNGRFRLQELTRSDDPLDLSWTVSDTAQRYGVGMGYRVPLVQPGVLDLGITGMYSEYDGSSFALTPIDFQGTSTSLDLALYGNPLSWEKEKSNFSYQLGMNYEKVESYNSIFQENAGGSFFTPRFSLSVESKGEIVRSIGSIVLRSNLSSISVEQREFMGGFEVEEKVPVLALSYRSMINLSKLFSSTNDPYADLDRHSLWLNFDAVGSLTNQRMLPQKQWLLGGASGVRGYPESIVAGDHGFLFSAEYRWKLLSLGTSPKKRFSLSLAPFFDYGQSFVKDPFFYESDQTLIGLGCGLLTELPGGGQARLDIAKPLKTVETDTGIREGTQSHDYRVHASTQWTF